MNKSCIFAVLFCLSVSMVSAQSAPAWAAPGVPAWAALGSHSWGATATPAWELSGGYQFVRGYVNCCENFGGYSAAIQENKSSWLGGVIDVGTSYHSVTGFAQSLLTVTAGPQFTYRKAGRLQPFARVMVGGANVRTTRPTSRFSETSFALAGGGGIDLYLTPKLYLRTKTDIIQTEFGSDTQVYGQASIGVVYRMGSLFRNTAN
jgi:hypothetical protein